MNERRWNFTAIGTQWEIATQEPLHGEDRDAVTARIESFDLAWSRFRPDSTVRAIAQGGSVPAPPETGVLLGVYRELHAATGGAVSPLIGGVLERRGYDASLTGHDSGASEAPDAAALTWTDTELRLATPAVIDVGAAGKGLLVDLVAQVLAGRIQGPFVVDASGDIAVRGGPVRVALEHPYDVTKAIGVWEITDEALCASAINRRAWGDGLHHVLDAHTGEPVRRYAATWVRGADAMRADAAATALFFEGGAELAERWGVTWARMTTDGRLEYSAGGREGLFR